MSVALASLSKASAFLLDNQDQSPSWISGKEQDQNQPLDEDQETRSDYIKSNVKNNIKDMNDHYK